MIRATLVASSLSSNVSLSYLNEKQPSGTYESSSPVICIKLSSVSFIELSNKMVLSSQGRTYTLSPEDTMLHFN